MPVPACTNAWPPRACRCSMQGPASWGQSWSARIWPGRRLGCCNKSPKRVMRRLSTAHLATTGFAFTASHFLFACAKEKVTKEKAHPASWFRCAQLDSLRSPSGSAFGCYSASLRFLASALFRGSSRWAILGPSCLIWHPCQMPLSTAPPFGLLTGPGDRGACTICGSGLDREARQTQLQNAVAPSAHYPPRLNARIAASHSGPAR